MKTCLHRFPVALAAILATFGVQFSATYVGATAFTYQGYLQGNDSSCDGLYDFQFRLYDAPTNGSQIGPLLQVVAVPVRNGLFAVALDFGEQALPGRTCWLHVGVQTNGATRVTSLSPRQAITPTPYALRAVAAEVADYAANAAGMISSNLTALADQTLLLKAPSVVLQSDRLTNTVTSSAYQTVGLDLEELVGGQRSVLVGGGYETGIGGNVTAALGKDVLVQTGGGLAATFAKTLAVDTQGGCGLSANEDLTFTSGKDAVIQAGTLFEARADDQLALHTGDATILMKKDGTTTITGKDITIKGDGDIAIRGSRMVIQGSGVLTARTNSTATFRSVASETNDLVVGIAGESAATNGIGVLGLATTETNNAVHVGVLAVADGGDKRLALLANCVTNDLLPATAVPRPAAIAGRAREKQDILQGYGHGDALCFRVAESGTVYAANTAVQPVDLAERIPVSETVEAAEVVEVDPEHAGSFRRTREPYSVRVAGVVSTQPGYLLGHDESCLDNDTRPPLALAGRVPVKVSLEGGAIRPGDLLASSFTPGHAMKAREPWRGGIIGTALGAFDGVADDTGKIELLVRVSPAPMPSAQLNSLHFRIEAQEARIAALEQLLREFQSVRLVVEE